MNSKQRDKMAKLYETLAAGMPNGWKCTRARKVGARVRAAVFVRTIPILDITTNVNTLVVRKVGQGWQWEALPVFAVSAGHKDPTVYETAETAACVAELWLGDGGGKDSTTFSGTTTGRTVGPARRPNIHARADEVKLVIDEYRSMQALEGLSNVELLGVNRDGRYLSDLDLPPGSGHYGAKRR